MKTQERKEYRIKPSIKQINAVNNLVENRGQSIGGAMIKAGYDPITAKNPKNLTESRGFKQLCDECGLTDTLILKSLSDDIRGKKHRRVQELALGAKIKGMLVERSINANVNISFDEAFKGIDD